MIWRKGTLVIACLLLLIPVVSAEIPDLLTVSGSPDWPVANTVDTSTITIQVRNLTSLNPVSAVPVNFYVEDVLYGNVSPTDAVTNGFGFATTTFKVNKTSGIAFIHAVVSYSTGGPTTTNEVIYPQKIDHGPAYSSALDYQGEVIVDQTTPFILTLKDLYGNRVDNKNPAYIHTVKFVMNLPPGGLGTGGLKNATPGSVYLTTIYESTDSKGNISLTAKVDTIPGENNIRISPIEDMPNPLYPYIIGLAQAPPFYIEQVFSPEGTPPSLPADQTAYFSIQYTLLDRYRNPSGYKTLQIFTSENESLGNLTSNSLGQIGITFGPRSTTGLFNITAVAIENTSVKCSKIVEFYSVDPVSMVVTANPQMIPSRDVPTNPPVIGKIIAKIMDVMGNPTENESVTFTLPVSGYTNSTILTKIPSFSSTTNLNVKTATTDKNGTAIIDFYPGEFPISGSRYSANATGTQIIVATWQGLSIPITVTFKNYPYLRVETSVNPSVVNVTSTFDVDIKLIGDGWLLQSKDIDVMLVFDRSGSMGDDSPTRISQAKTATTTFIDQLTSRDQVGLVSFASSTTLDKSLTNNFPDVKTKINSLSASGSTQLRNGINTAITNLRSYGREGSVKAIIIMTDGNWNSHGTPLGHGTGWPANNSEYTFSGSDLEPDNYRWYDGLGGTLTPYTSTETCSVYSTTVCDDYANRCDQCAPGYTGPSGGGRCQWTSGTGHDHNWYYPNTKPASCSVKQCDEWHCNVFATLYKCTDGEFTDQNMSRYADESHIKLYTISFASTLDPVAVNGLEVMADNTGGFYQHAPTGADLKNIYLQIAGELRILAGVNTQMNISFQNVNVTYNNVTSYMPGKDVFDYIYSQGQSTWVTSWNQTQNPLQVQVPKPPNPDVLPNFGDYTEYPYSFNQRDEWLSTSGLTFNAGNISINQTWETKFRFRVNATGNIDIFGPGSKIIFNNGESELELPHTYISAVQNLTNVGLNATQLDIYNLHSTVANVTNDYIPLSWQINYGGNQTVTEEISWLKEGGPTSWTMFQINYITYGTFTDYAILNVRNFEPGTYYIRVKASAPDAAEDIEYITTPGFTVGTAGRIYIKLE